VTINSGDTFAYVRDNTTPQAEISASISLEVSVSDASEAGSGQGTITTSTPGTFSSIAFDSGNLIRYGRLRILGATGVAFLPLTVPIRTQYWNGLAFVLNSSDHCTTLDRANIALGDYANNLNACETRVNQSTVSFVSGLGSLSLRPPGGSNTGSVVLAPQLGMSATGNYCATVPGSESSAVGASKSYLQGAWTGAGYDQNPSARASFGTFGAQPRNFIFYRENY